MRKYASIMVIEFTHFMLSIGIFLLVNWLGLHAPSGLGYYQLSIGFEAEKAPAFNFVFRVLTPVVVIIIASAAFYSFHLDTYVNRIYLVSVYYVLLRTAFNIASNRTLLLNWWKVITNSVVTVGLTYFIYHKLIISKVNLLPDFTNMANELWIIIAVFIYSVANNFQPSADKTQIRRARYVEVQFAKCNRLYSPIILKQTSNLRLRQLALAIIIYEDFNRPKLFRLVEYLFFIITRKKLTMGVMQVASDRVISDSRSVELGVKKLIEDFHELRERFINDSERNYDVEYKDVYYQRQLIEKFNPDLIYSNEVLELAETLNKKYFSDAPRRLFTD